MNDFVHDLKADLDARDRAIAERINPIDARLKQLEQAEEQRREIESRERRPGRTTGRGGEDEAKAFNAFVRSGRIEHRSMSIAGGAADGAATVPKMIASQIISKAISLSPLASLVRRTPVMTSDYRRLVNVRGATAAWSSETGTRNSTSTPAMREIQFSHGELYAVPTITNWLLNDSQFNLEQFVRDNVADTFAKALEAAILTGDASNKPRGIFNSAPTAVGDDDSPARGADVIEVVAQEDDGASPPNVVLSNSLIKLYFRLKSDYRRNGRWLVSSAQLAKIRKLKGSDGQFIFQPNLAAGVDAGDGLLLGKPVHVAEALDDIVLSTPDAGNPVLFGDFQQAYELPEVGDMTIIRDQVTVRGSTVLYIAQRFGGRLTDNDAIKAMVV
jgi:HK97 family phage major capsid protein